MYVGGVSCGRIQFNLHAMFSGATVQALLILQKCMGEYQNIRHAIGTDTVFNALEIQCASVSEGKTYGDGEAEDRMCHVGRQIRGNTCVRIVICCENNNKEVARLSASRTKTTGMQL